MAHYPCKAQVVERLTLIVETDTSNKDKTVTISKL